MSSRMRIILIMGLAVFLAGWLSYRRAYSRASSGHATREAPRKNDRRLRPVEKTSDPMEDLRRLRKGPVNARSSAAAWSVISRFSVRQLKDALADLPEDGGEATIDQQMMLYFHWARIDPLDALEAAGQEGKNDEDKQRDIHSAFTAWMKKDPDAAYQWAMKSGSINKEFASLQMAVLLGALPAEESLEKAKSYSPMVTARVLSRLGGTMGGTEAGREAFLALLAGSGADAPASDSSLKALARSWGAVDPMAALSALKDLPMDENTREQTRRQVVNHWTQKDPAAVIGWMTTGENPQPLATRIDVYQKWAERDPGQAAMSFENLSRQSPGFRDEVMKSLVTSYRQGGWIPFGRTPDSDRVLFSRLKIHYDQWAAQDPQQASTWAATLDPALQQRLQSRDPNEKN